MTAVGFKTVIIYATLLLLSSIPLVVSQPYPDEWFGPIPFGNPLLIIVAYDEEIANSNYDWFGKSVDGRTYVRYQTIRALYRFPSDMFHFGIIDYVEWDSEDDATLEESLLEVESEMGWNRGMMYHGNWVNLLIAWTGQESAFVAGKAYIGHAVCITTHQTDWTDDNTVQEEVTHLFGVDSHCNDDGCVMSVKQNFYGFISENLRPIENRTVDWIPIFNNQAVGSVSHGWCSNHYSKLLESEGYPDRSRDIISSHPKINPVNPPPEDKGKINPTNPWVPWLILVIVLAIVAMAAVYIYKRKRKE